jgi:ATP-dependent 26S proteasome regulatory subunit
MIGPPGAGKTLLARAYHCILEANSPAGIARLLT